MNINYVYKIYWFEDQDSWLGSEEIKLKRKFEESKLEFEIVSYKDASNIDEITSETEIDILLMDYNLSGVKGDDLIVRLRENNVLCDIIFYSDAPDFAKSLTETEGVMTTPRQSVSAKLYACVQNCETLIENVSTMRGTYITSAIDLEIKMNGIISGFLGLNPYKENFIKENVIETEFFNVGAKIKVVSRIGKELLKDIKERLAAMEDGPEKQLLLKEEVRLEKTRIIFKTYPDEIMHVRNTLAHSKHDVGEDGRTTLRHITNGDTHEIDGDWIRKHMKHLVVHSTNLDRFRTFIK